MMNQFAIGIYYPKFENNVGSLMRSAMLYNANFVFTVGQRYSRQATDTVKTPDNIPLFHFPDIDDLLAHKPLNFNLIGVEMDERAISLPKFSHPKAGMYLLGAENIGLPEDVMDKCDSLVSIPTPRPWSMNVASAGAVLMYDRECKI